MKAPARLTRRRLGAALALPLAAAAGKAEPLDQQQQQRTGRVKSAAAKVRKARIGKNISPAFRFIP
jgi:hypothetical protein